MPTQPTERKQGRDTSEYGLAKYGMIVAFAWPFVAPIFEKYVAALPKDSVIAVLAGGLISIGYGLVSVQRKKAILEADSAAVKQPETITAGGDVNLQPAPSVRGLGQGISGEAPVAQLIDRPFPPDNQASTAPLNFVQDDGLPTDSE